jgi:hypothetical protein
MPNQPALCAPPVRQSYIKTPPSLLDCIKRIGP